MYIHEAVKKAVKEDKVIYRSDIAEMFPETRKIVIFPTSSYVTCCIATVKKGVVKDISHAWNPTADDLTSKKWEVEERPQVNEMI